MTALALPASPRTIWFHPQNVSQSGGVATNGMEKIVGFGGGRWTGGLDALVTDDDQVLAWRAFLAGVKGRTNTILVPATDGRRANWPIDNVDRVLSPAFVRRPILDGTIYEDPVIPTTTSEILAHANASGSVGAVSLAINVTQGAAIRAGQYFGVANRLYLISEITDAVAGLQTATFWPPLREAVAGGATVKLSRPVCEMRFASDDQGRLALDMLRFGSLSLEFVEAY